MKKFTRGIMDWDMIEPLPSDMIGMNAQLTEGIDSSIWIHACWSEAGAVEISGLVYAQPSLDCSLAVPDEWFIRQHHLILIRELCCSNGITTGYSIGSSFLKELYKTIKQLLIKDFASSPPLTQVCFFSDKQTYMHFPANWNRMRNHNHTDLSMKKSPKQDMDAVLLESCQQRISA